MTKKDQVVNYIKGKITEGQWKIGEAIPSEPHLAKEIGVSRMSIREGIEQLSIQRILEKKKGSGTFVREVTPTISFSGMCPDIELHTKGYKEILEVRIVLETLALQKAMKVSKEDLEVSLERILDKMKQSVSDENFIDDDMAFHIEIAKCSGNMLLLGLLQLSSSALKVHRKNIEYKYVKNEIRIKEHEKVLLAIKNNDVKKAEKYLKSHLEKAISKMQD